MWLHRALSTHFLALQIHRAKWSKAERAHSPIGGSQRISTAMLLRPYGHVRTIIAPDFESINESPSITQCPVRCTLCRVQTDHLSSSPQDCVARRAMPADGPLRPKSCFPPSTRGNCMSSTMTSISVRHETPSVSNLPPSSPSPVRTARNTALVGPWP